MEGAGALPAPSVASVRSSLVPDNTDLTRLDALPQARALERFNETFAALSSQDVANIDGYVLFASHVDALALFQASKEAGVSARISPTPRDARSSCGVALLIPCEEARRVFDVACKHNISIENMVALPRQIDAHRDRYC